MTTWFLCRSRTALILLLPLLALSACNPYPPAVPVSFPDDPRVLHGEWIMDLELVDWYSSRHLYLPQHDLLLTWTWTGDEARGWQQDAGGGWSDFPADAFIGLGPASYDQSLDAFVTFRTAGGTGHATVVSLPDGSRSQVSFELPADVRQLATATGSGNVFLFAQTASSGPRLYWWSATDGSAGGSIAMRSAPEGVRRSANGRSLSFWDMRRSTVHVIDTAAPAEPVGFRLAICSTNGLAEASSDGRWFAVRECGGWVSIVDLQAERPERMRSGLGGDGFVGFAVDSPELLHVGAGGLVRSHHPVSGETSDLFTVAEADLDWSPYTQQLSLHRGADVLTVQSGQGRVLQVGIDSGELHTELPEPVRGSLLLQLSASNLRQDAYSHSYDITGSAEWPASLGEPVPVTLEGTVSSSGLHEYRPGLNVQAAPPPMVDIYGQLNFAADEQLSLYFTTMDAQATEYPGSVSHEVDRVEYRALLRRP